MSGSDQWRTFNAKLGITEETEIRQTVTKESEKRSKQAVTAL